MDKNAIKTIHYTDKNGRDYFADWLLGLRNDKAMAAIASRIARVSAGNFGDCKPLRDGVRELRVDAGPGYRVYYAKDGLTIVLLLCGGDKRSQNRDIDRACDLWREWRERKKGRRKMTDKEQETMGKSHDEFMIEHLRENPAFAVELLNVAIEENTPDELAIILRQIRAADIRVSSVAPKPAPRKRARPGAAKKAKRLPANRGRTRRSVAAIA